MKIAVMLRNLGEKGGIVVYARNLLDQILRQDTKNEYVFLYRYAEDIGRFGTRSNLSEVVIPARSKLWWDQVCVPIYAIKNNIDLIYNPKLSIPLVHNKKCVWVMHGGAQVVVPHLFQWHDRLYFKIANRLYSHRADAIITMTQLGADDLVRLMGVDRKKLYVTHEGYNPLCKVVSPDKKLMQKYSINNKYILFVGGIAPVKNFGNLLRAFRLIAEQYPYDLVVVGFKRWRYEEDLRFVEELGLRDRVKFTGFVPDEEIPHFYNMAELFLFPSIYEGFGIPALEALACGCPVITSKTGCTREVVGDAALLVDPYSPEDIASGMRRILEDDSLKQDLIERGLDRAKNFSWEACASNTIKVFESLDIVK